MSSTRARIQWAEGDIVACLLRRGGMWWLMGFDVDVLGSKSWFAMRWLTCRADVLTIFDEESSFVREICYLYTVHSILAAEKHCLERQR